MLVDSIEAYEKLKLLTYEILDNYSSFEFSKHFREDHHEGGWLASNLKSNNGSNYGNEKSKFYTYEKKIDCLPNTKKFLEEYFPSSRRIRLMLLKGNNSIFWHYDEFESADYGLSRIHIPIKTSSQIKTRISHDISNWKIFRIYYGDFSFPHRVDNKGDSDWLHLVIDYEGEVHKFFEKSDLFKTKNIKIRRIIRPIAQFICDFYCMHRGIKDIKRFISRYFLRYLVRRK